MPSPERLRLALVVALALPGLVAASPGWKKAWAAGQRAHRAGDGKAAEAAWLEAYRLAKQLGLGDPRFVTTLKALAGLYRKQGRRAAEEASLLRILSALERSPGAEPRDRTSTLARLAELRAEKGELDAAARAFDSARQSLDAAASLSLKRRVLEGSLEVAGRRKDAPTQQALLAALIPVLEAAKAPAAKLDALRRRRAEGLLAAGQADAAVAALKPASSAPANRLLRGRALLAAGQLAAARAELEAALQGPWRPDQGGAAARGRAELALGRAEVQAGERDRGQERLRNLVERLELDPQGEGPLLLEAALRLGQSMLAAGRPADAEPMLARAAGLARREGLAPPALRAEAVDALAARRIASGDLEAGAELLAVAAPLWAAAEGTHAAQATHDWAAGFLAIERKRPVEARAPLQRAVAAMGDDPQAAAVRLDLAELELQLGRASVAQALAAKAGAQLEAHGDTSSPLRVRQLRVEGQAATLAEKHDAARAALKKALAVVDGRQPKDPAEVGDACLALGKARLEAGDLGEADTYLRLARQARLQARGAASVEVAEVDLALAGLARAKRSLLDAERQARDVLKRLEAELGPDHAGLVPALLELAEVLKRRALFAAAAPMLDRAVDLATKEGKGGTGALPEALVARGILRQLMQRGAEARADYDTARALRAEALGEVHPGVAECLNLVASMDARAGQHAQAAAGYARAEAIYREALGADHSKVAALLNNRAGLAARAGDDGETERLLREALALFDRSLGSDHPTTGRARSNLATWLRQKGRGAEADALRARVKK